MIRTLYVMLTFCLFACKDQKETRKEQPLTTQLTISYAKGFSVSNYESHSELIINSPWPNSTKSFRYALVKESTSVLNADDYDGIINVPIEKVIVTSTTHIPALELLGEGNSLIGFPGTDYVSSAFMRDRIENGLIKELGQNEELNTEVILTLEPDVLVGFGIDGVNKAFETLKNGGIPIIYNGDWTEDSPLAKAEWIKFFGVLFDKEAEAEATFKQIETDYIMAKELASKVETRPSVLSGAMHKEVWYLPQGTSPEGQFLNDANVNYLWKETSGSGSLALSFESVFLKAKDADIWINPSYFTSYEQLASNNTLYSKFKAFSTESIYSMSMTKGATGGVLYYELGTARPDLVLKDIIKICHPHLLQDYETTFFKPLENGIQ